MKLAESIASPLLHFIGDLVDRGWQPVFEAHGLDLRKARSIDALLEPLPKIDRTKAGFEDLCSGATRALEPGMPARSLLYHALAHPCVHPPNATESSYASIGELDLVENAIYALTSVDHSLDEDLVAAVFAYQYRPAKRTPHEAHADLVFSRMGIARLGSWEPRWNGAWRSFHVEDKPDSELRVRPARYGVFLARRVRPSELSLMCGMVEGDDERSFLLPVHKLFDGDACLATKNLTLEWKEHHRNEKLHRAVKRAGLRIPDHFNPDAAPFVRDSRTDANMAVLTKHGSSIVAGPKPARFIRVARQTNSTSKKEEVVGFTVPHAFWTFFKFRHQFTTLHHIADRVRGFFQLISDLLPGRERHVLPRPAPEFINIRHRVKDAQTVEDLNVTILDKGELKKTLKKGGYAAAMFEDSICDGCITAAVEGLDRRVLPAFSVLAAADYMPWVDQATLQKYFTGGEPTGKAVREHWKRVFSHGTPRPLCMGRLSANPAIIDPTSSGARAFEDDETMAAIVSATASSAKGSRDVVVDGPISWLPDAAADHFAPGWDVTFDVIDDRKFYHTYGLGSPFVEDLKLCAAGAGSWPAVAPDASRTFHQKEHPTAVPLLDCELGLHPEHPLVRASRAVSTRGWDGEYGPFLRKIGGHWWVDYADIDRSDYVTNTLDKRIRTDLLCNIRTADLLLRIDALERAIRIAPPEGDLPTKTKLWLVTAEAVDDWATREDRLDASLAGAGLRFIFVVAEDGDAVPSRSDSANGPMHRLRIRAERIITCHVTAAEEYASETLEPA